MCKKIWREKIFSLFVKIAKPFFGHNLGSIYPLRIMTNFLLSYFRDPDKPIIIEGNKMFLDKKDSLRLSLHSHEPLETDLIKKIIKEGNVVLDIGAHIGYYALLFAKLVGGKGKVFAFEPHPDNFALLKKNVETNNYKNVVLVNRAVSNKNKKIKLYSADSTGDYKTHSLKNSFFIEVESIRLDDYFKNYQGKINFIKIDVEGAEKEVAEGMSFLLQQNKRIKMMTEIFPQRLEEAGVKLKDYLELLKSFDFQFYYLNEKKKRIELRELDQLLKIFSFKKAANLFCLKEK